jgi:hypothetical protein
MAVPNFARSGCVGNFPSLAFMASPLQQHLYFYRPPPSSPWMKGIIFLEVVMLITDAEYAVQCQLGGAS